MASDPQTYSFDTKTLSGTDASVKAVSDQVENILKQSLGNQQVAKNIMDVASIIGKAAKKSAAIPEKGAVRDESGLGYILPQGSSDWAVPHEQTFSSIFQYAQKLYLARFDEAMRRSEVDFLAMRRDGFIDGLLHHRMMPVVSLRHKITTDDSDDKEQKRIADELEAIVAAIPRFQTMKLNLDLAIWPGKSGIQIRWGIKKIRGKKRVLPIKHKHVNGDKFIFGWDDVPHLLVHSGYVPAEGTDELVRTDRGMALKLSKPFYRDRFIIHEFEPTDPDFLYESEKAQSIHGLGLRDRIYYLWWFRAEILGYVMDALERIAANGQVIGYYDMGNDAMLEAMKTAIKSLHQYNATLIPRSQINPGSPMIDRHNASNIAYDVMINVIQYMDEMIRFAVLGQNLSSETGSTGMGSGVAELHRSTFENIVRFDAVNLAETMDQQLIQKIINFNTWEYKGKTYHGELPFDTRFEFHLETEDVMQSIQTAGALIQMGIQIDTDEVRDKAGFSPPKPSQQQAADQGGPPAPGQAGPTGPAQDQQAPPDDQDQPQPEEPDQSAAQPPPPHQDFLNSLGSMAQTARYDRTLTRYERHEGVMIALVPSRELAASLAVGGKLESVTPSGELHVSLAYLGKASDLTAEAADVLRWATKSFASQQAPLQGHVGGQILFPDNSGEGEPYCTSVDLPELATFHHHLTKMLDLIGMPASTEHGYTPHMTLAYLKPDDPTPFKRVPKMEASFNSIVLAIGDKWEVFPIGQPAVTAVSVSEARKIGASLGIDWTTSPFYPDQLADGIIDEMEHGDVIGTDKRKAAQIALAHLRETPDYYYRLKQMEHEAKKGQPVKPENNHKVRDRESGLI